MVSAPVFPYENYDRFDFGEIDPAECKERDLPELVEALGIPEVFACDQGRFRGPLWLAEWCKIQGIKITSNINNQSTVQHFLSRSTIKLVQFQRLIQQPKLKTRLIQKKKVSQHQQQLRLSTTTNQITSKPTSKQSQLQQQNTFNNLGTWEIGTENFLWHAGK